MRNRTPVTVAASYDVACACQLMGHKNEVRVHEVTIGGPVSSYTLGR